MGNQSVDEQIFSTLKGILRWTKFSGMIQLKKVIAENLTSNEEIAVFDASDGTRSTRDVASIVHVSYRTVARYWRKWAKIGIVEPSQNYQGRVQKICSLEEIGLASPLAQEEASDEAADEVMKNEHPSN